MDLDKVLNEMSTESDAWAKDISAKANKKVSDEKTDWGQESDTFRKLTAPEQEIVRNLVSSDMPANVTSQVKTLLAQGARWMTFEELLKAFIEILTAGSTKTVSVSDVPSLNKSSAMKARKSGSME